MSHIPPRRPDNKSEGAGGGVRGRGGGCRQTESEINREGGIEGGWGEDIPRVAKVSEGEREKETAR